MQTPYGEAEPIVHEGRTYLPLHFLQLRLPENITKNIFLWIDLLADHWLLADETQSTVLAPTTPWHYTEQVAGVTVEREDWFKLGAGLLKWYREYLKLPKRYYKDALKHIYILCFHYVVDKIDGKKRWLPVEDADGEFVYERLKHWDNLVY